MNFIFLLFNFIFICFSTAFTQSVDREKPNDAYIRILNCCDTTQTERWKTGLDLKFKDNYIGRDIRLATYGPVGKISYVGRDFIEVFRTGETEKPIAQIPATLKPGGFYSVVVMGIIGKTDSDVVVKLIEEYPLTNQERPPGTFRMVVLNAIKNYPVLFRPVGDKTSSIPKFSETAELNLPLGEQEMELIYENEERKTITNPWIVLIEEGGDYLTVIHPSRDRGSLPTLLQLNMAEARATLLSVTRDKDTEETSRDDTANP
jgi:hypothetical protein